MKAKRAITWSIVPVIVGLGACSSSSGNNGNGSTSSSSVDAATGAQEAGSIGDAASDSSANASSGSGGSSSGTTPYTATLTGYQVYPTPVKTSASGTAQLTLLADNVTLQYTITLTGLSSSVTAVNLHVGSAVETSSPAFQLYTTGGDSGVSTGAGQLTVTGQVTLTSDEFDDLDLGQLYIDVFTANHTAGEIRGQIVPPGYTVLVANMTGAQEVPPVSSSFSAAAAVIVSSDGTTVRYHIVPGSGLSTQEISGINWGVAIGGEPNSLGTGGGLMTNTDGSITSSSAAPWLNGEVYLNITTQMHPNGELRGQLIMPGETLFTSTLQLTAAAASNSHATGAAEVILDPTGTTVRYEVDTAGTSSLTGVTLNFGGFPGGAANTTDAGADAGADAGTSGADAGAVIASLPLTIAGSISTDEPADGAALSPLAVTAADVAQLTAGNAWVLVDTNSYGSGELQGLLIKQ